MSNRTMLEFNHDYCPRDEDLIAFAKDLQTYMRSGDPKLLPYGVTWFGMRHHSTPCPLTPPRGWMNEKPNEGK
jgi:hypothetical protein